MKYAGIVRAQGILLGIWLLITAGPAAASYQGVVNDSTTSAPLESVRVQLQSTMDRVYTNSLGRFIITPSSVALRDGVPGKSTPLFFNASSRTITWNGNHTVSIKLYTINGAGVATLGHAGAGSCVFPDLAEGIYIADVEVDGVVDRQKVMVAVTTIAITLPAGMTAGNVGKAADMPDTIFFTKPGYWPAKLAAADGETNLVVTLAGIAPRIITRPIISSGWADVSVNGINLRMGFAGVPITMIPGVWDSVEGNPQVVGCWYDPRAKRVLAGSGPYTFTPTQADVDSMVIAIWRETATRAGKITVAYSTFYVQIKPVPQAAPAQSGWAFPPTGLHAAGATVTRVPINWSNPFLSHGFGTMTVSGQWVKNGVPTGITDSTYAVTAEGDMLKWRETATNFCGSTTADSRGFYVSDRVLTLAAGINAEVAALTTGNPGGAAGMNVFATKDHTTRTYVRNPNLWCASLVPQLTGVVVYKRNESYGGVMITPRHVLFCEHAHPWASGTWPVNNYAPFDATTRFVKTDNTVVDRQQIAQASVSGVDYCVALLDSTVPEGIHVVPIMAGAKEFWDLLLEQGGVPFFGASQGFGRIPTMVPPTPASDYPAQNAAMFYIKNAGFTGLPANNPYRTFDYSVYDGDSGTPAFFTYQGTVYLYWITTMAPWGGWQVSYRTTEINQLIVTCDSSAVARGVLDAPTGLTVSAVNPFQ